MAINWNSKTSQVISLLLAALMLAMAVIPAAAQDDANTVRYVVQPGDTLSSIALRFDVSVSDLVNANSISNPNSLDVGDVLVIPGIDWIEGTLVLEAMPVGENYLSLKRRYLLSDEDMAKLNRFTATSPDQFYQGFQIMLATDHGELTDSGRGVVAPGGSLLEVAAMAGDNPWRVAAVNQLQGTWEAVPGDVLFTPALQQAGPGGLPSPISNLSVDEPGFEQGHTIEMHISGGADMALSGELIDHPLNFFTQGDGSWVSLGGIPLDAVGGLYALQIDGTTAAGTPFSFSQPVRVTSGDFGRSSLFVDDPALLDESLEASEVAQIAELTAPVTDKLWDGLWGWPHDLVTDVTSGYGEFRTYNGGIVSRYHTGTDFGGGALLAIYAPARGTVVFAGPLNIRGNATVIDHGWGVYSGYWHQSESYVSVGDVVEPGEIIGLVGGTGRVKGPHLHWEVWVGGVPVDPLDWLARAYP